MHTPWLLDSVVDLGFDVHAALHEERPRSSRAFPYPDLLVPVEHCFLETFFPAC